MTLTPATLSFVVCDEVPDTDAWLGPDEVKACGRYRLPKRRREWRAGRWAAKTAAAKWLEVVPTPPSPPTRWAELQILAAEDGAPQLWRTGAPQPIPVSISHRDGLAAAAISTDGRALGIDVERIEPRSQRFVQDYFTSREVETCREAPPHVKHLLPVLIWSAKESALKAIRQGLRRDTRTIEVSIPAWKQTGWTRLRVDDLLGGNPFESYACRRGEHVVTLAYL